MKPIFYCVILSLCLFFSGCKKEEMSCGSPYGEAGGHPLDSLGLPYATSEGLNTMGCLIDGEPWLALRENVLGDIVYHIPFSITNGALFIVGIDGREDPVDGITLSADGVDIIDSYSFASQLAAYEIEESECGFYNLDSTYFNFIEVIYIDFDDEIISGRFEMRVVNPDCDTLTITNGRFDLSS
jgi:hypothetical protein